MAEKYDNLAIRLKYRDGIKKREYSWVLYSMANEIIPYRIMRRIAKKIELPERKELSVMVEGITLEKSSINKA